MEAGPDLPVIDTHVHFWQRRRPPAGMAWAWLEDDYVHPVMGYMGSLKCHEYTIEDYWAEARFSGIQGLVHVHAAVGSSDVVAETRWLCAMARRAPVPMAIVGGIDLGSPAARAILDAHCEHPGFIGVRDMRLDCSASDPGRERLLAAMADRGLVLDLHASWNEARAVRELAERHPELTIVLEHLGSPHDADNDTFLQWRLALAQLASAPNVVCKISGVGMLDRRFTSSSLRPWIEVCISVFGPQRCMVGSNWPIDRLASSFDAIMSTYRTSLARLDADEQAVVLSGTARRVYRLQGGGV